MKEIWDFFNNFSYGLNKNSPNNSRGMEYFLVIYYLNKNIYIKFKNASSRSE